MQDEAFIISLLRKQWQGESLSIEDQNKFETWKQNNRHSYRMYEKIWKDAPQLKLQVSTDVEEQYRKFSISRKRQKAPVWYAAAVVALILISSLGYFLLPPDNTILKNEQSNSYLSYTLDDGSKIWLNANSRLEIHSDFNKTKREVELSGEAYFEVADDKSKPFVVRNRYSTIRVTGTSFNAIATDSLDAVMLLEGCIVFGHDIDTISLVPGERAKMNQQRHLDKTTFKSKNFLAWKTGILRFEDQPLGVIARELEQHHRIKIDIDEDSSKKCRLTIVFDNLSLEETLRELQFLLDIDYTINKHSVLISGSGC